MANRLETASNVVIVVVGLLVGVAVIKNRILAPPGPQSQSVAVKAGDRVGSVPGYSWAAHDRTLLLVLRKGCVYCENSIPLYKRLASLEKEGHSSVHLLAVLPDDMEAVRGVLGTHNLELQAIAGVDPHTVKVSGTPTLILVDHEGRALKSWVGQLTADLQAEVIRTVQR